MSAVAGGRATPPRPEAEREVGVRLEVDQRDGDERARMEQKVAEKETTETKKEVAASVARPHAPSQTSQQKQFASTHEIIR